MITYLPTDRGLDVWLRICGYKLGSVHKVTKVHDDGSVNLEGLDLAALKPEWVEPVFYV